MPLPAWCLLKRRTTWGRRIVVLAEAAHYRGCRIVVLAEAVHYVGRRIVVLAEAVHYVGRRIVARRFSKRSLFSPEDRARSTNLSGRTG